MCDTAQADPSYLTCTQLSRTAQAHGTDEVQAGGTNTLMPTQILTQHLILQMQLMSLDPQETNGMEAELSDPNGWF